MSDTLMAQVRATFGDFAVPGVPASGAKEPSKAEIRALFFALIAAFLADAGDLGEDLQDDIAAVASGLAGKQNLDGTLSALAGLTVAANKLIYATGADAFATTDLSAFGRSVLSLANAPALRALAETYSATAIDDLLDDKMEFDATLHALAGLVVGANKLIYATGPDAFATTDLSAFGRSVLSLANAPALRALAETYSATAIDDLLDDKMEFDATLHALAGLAVAANKLIYATGPDAFATTDLSAFGRSLLALANGPALRSLANVYSQDEIDAVLAIGTQRRDYQTQGRPGEAPGRYSAELTGEGDAATPYSDADVVIGPRGKALRVVGAARIAPIEAYKLTKGETATARVDVSRAANPSDPAGDTVRFGLQFLNAAKGHVSRQTVSDQTPVVADGRIVHAVTMRDQAGEGVDKVWPPTAEYVRPYVETYGPDGETHIEFLAPGATSDLALGAAEAVVSAAQAAATAAVEAKNDALTATGDAIEATAAAQAVADSGPALLAARDDALGAASDAADAAALAIATVGSKQDRHLVVRVSTLPHRPPVPDITSAEVDQNWRVTRAVDKHGFVQFRSEALSAKQDGFTTIKYSSLPHRNAPKALLAVAFLDAAGYVTQGLSADRLVYQPVLDEEARAEGEEARIEAQSEDLSEGLGIATAEDRDQLSRTVAAQGAMLKVLAAQLQPAAGVSGFSADEILQWDIEARVNALTLQRTPHGLNLKNDLSSALNMILGLGQSLDIGTSGYQTHAELTTEYSLYGPDRPFGGVLMMGQMVRGNSAGTAGNVGVTQSIDARITHTPVGDDTLRPMRSTVRDSVYTNPDVAHVQSAAQVNALSFAFALLAETPLEGLAYEYAAMRNRAEGLPHDFATNALVGISAGVGGTSINEWRADRLTAVAAYNSDTVYANGALSTNNGHLWRSKANGNIGNVPVVTTDGQDGAYWAWQGAYFERAKSAAAALKAKANTLAQSVGLFAWTWSQGPGDSTTTTIAQYKDGLASLETGVRAIESGVFAQSGLAIGLTDHEQSTNNGFNFTTKPAGSVFTKFDLYDSNYHPWVYISDTDSDTSNPVTSDTTKWRELNRRFEYSAAKTYAAYDWAYDPATGVSKMSLVDANTGNWASGAHWRVVPGSWSGNAMTVDVAKRDYCNAHPTLVNCGANYLADDRRTHGSNNSYRQRGIKRAEVLDHVARKGLSWKATQPADIRVRDNQILITFHAPSGELTVLPWYDYVTPVLLKDLGLRVFTGAHPLLTGAFGETDPLNEAVVPVSSGAATFDMVKGVKNLTVTRPAGTKLSILITNPAGDFLTGVPGDFVLVSYADPVSAGGNICGTGQHAAILKRTYGVGAPVDPVANALPDWDRLPDPCIPFIQYAQEA